MKRLLLLLLLFYPTLWAGTQYNPASTGADSVSTSGVRRYRVTMQAINQNSFAMLYTQGSGINARLLYTDDAGTTWATHYNVFSKAVYAGSSIGLYKFGSYYYANYSGNGVTDSMQVRQWDVTDGTLSAAILDTINGYKGGTVGGDDGINRWGDSILVFHESECGATDTSYILLTTGGFVQNATYSVIDKAPWNKGSGTRINALHGMYIMENTTEDLFWGDPYGGFDTLSASVVPYNIVNQDAELAVWLTPYMDSLFGIIWQVATAGSDSLTIYRCRGRALGAGSGTVAYDDTALIEKADSLPTPNLTTFLTSAEPVISWVNGTRWVYIFYKHWPDQSNLDSANIVYRLSSDTGRTFGARTILVPAINSNRRWHLSGLGNMPYDAGTGRTTGWLAWSDSLGSNLDSLHLYKFTELLDSNIAATGPPQGILSSKYGIGLLSYKGGICYRNRR
jgi:hypothetical protein